MSSGSAPSSTSNRPRSASRSASRAEATPETRFAPAALWASLWRGRRISAVIAAVVVFPFVAETTAVPEVRPAARRSIASGSSWARSLPGIVVPPPAPTRRESAATPRAAAISSPRGGRGGRIRRGYVTAVERRLGHGCKGLLADFSTCSTLLDMAEKPRYRALASIDPQELAQFQAGIRKRYTDDQIVAEIVACAERLGRSPTMREFAADHETAVHPQTVIEHFGSWNAAKRAAGLVPRRFATREELLGLLRTLGDELGRPPTARDIDERKGRMPSKSLYWHTFGSLTNALREAGFDVPVGEERLERAVEQGTELAHALGRLPKFADWAEARKEDDTLLTEWQVYRMLDARRGAWSTFQFLVRERLDEQGVRVSTDGRLVKKR